MGRYSNKCRGRLPNKQDTPVKTGLSRGDGCRKLLHNKHHEAFPEEAELDSVPAVRPAKPMLTRIKPIHCKSMLRLINPALAKCSRGKAVSPAAPANKRSGDKVSPADHPLVQMTPDAEAYKGDEIKVKEEEQNLAVTPESILSSSMESDSTFSTNDDDDDEDEECYSSASATSSSLSSPEIFRRENCAETLTFPVKEELHLHIKNSTLLDLSRAENIYMHHPPNLSIIMDTSTTAADEKCETNKHKGPGAATKIHPDSFKSAFKWKTPAKLTNRRPIFYKKKVWFKSPIVAETFERKHIPATTLTSRNTNGPVQTSSPSEQIMPESDTSRAGEISSKEETLRLRVTLKRPVKSAPVKAKFFDFVSDRERDAFFQRMTERCVKLRSTPLFPLTAAKHTETWPCDS